MDAKQIVIRPAIETDLGAIARVLIDTWCTTFRGRLSDDFLDSMSYPHQESRHRRTMSLPGTSYAVAVVQPQQEIIGFANGGPNRQQTLSQAGELYALYVRDGWQRRGVGTRLFRAIVTEHQRHDRQSMFVWVLSENPNRAFYEKLGGQSVAGRPITLGPARVTEIAYAWDDLRLCPGASLPTAQNR
ncbi:MULTISPECIES: GNAT family N-acetyltransferase [unclassified Inquilinus]|uniref:GNAT family N-acetyltransferase n=1 Tax=unclassified Inquilinus TaxID=2645927 RepID=UPI003F9368DF